MVGGARERCIGVALVLVMALAGCRPSQEAARTAPSGNEPPGAPLAGPVSTAQPKRGGTLTVGLERDISHMNPFANTFSQDQFVRELMYDALLTYDDTGKILPHLAESWDISPDGKTYTFHLRRGVKFHNGQEMTAEDTAWSLNYIVNPRNGAYGFQRATVIDSAEAADTYTMRVTLKQPSPGFTAAMSEIKVGVVAPKNSLEEGVQKPATFPPGTGPFKFVQWDPKQRIVFERFDDYWGPKAHVDRVVFREINDHTVRLTALRAGDLDMMRATPYPDAKRIKDGEIPGVVGIEPRFTQNKRIAFNFVGSPFENKKLRQAVAYAVNREEMVQAIYFGLADPMDEQYPKGHEWYFEGMPTYPHDPEKARQMLQEAGYNGETYDLLLPPDSDDFQLGSLIQGQLRKIGMNVNLRVADAAAREDFSKTGNYQLDQRGANFDPDPSITYDADFRCDERRVSNRTGYCNPEVHQLLERAAVELDVNRRRELFRRAITIGFYEDVVYVPLLFVTKAMALRDYVKGFATSREAKFRSPVGGVQTAWLDK
jgi:peptide/nickel transport system substrate-binding protein